MEACANLVDWHPHVREHVTPQSPERARRVGPVLEAVEMSDLEETNIVRGYN